MYLQSTPIEGDDASSLSAEFSRLSSVPLARHRTMLPGSSKSLSHATASRVPQSTLTVQTPSFGDVSTIGTGLQESFDPNSTASKPRSLDDTYLSALKQYLSHSAAPTPSYVRSPIPHLIPTPTAPSTTRSFTLPIEIPPAPVSVSQRNTPRRASTLDTHLYSRPRSRDAILASNVLEDNEVDFSDSPTILVSGTPVLSPHDSSSSGPNALLSTSPSASLRSHSSGDYVTSPESHLTLTESAGGMRTRRWYVLTEIVESERMYVNDLRVLVDVYIHSLMTNLSLPLTIEQRKIVALNVDQLLQVHEPFAAELEKTADEYSIPYGVNQKETLYGLHHEPKLERAAVDAVSQCFLNLALRLEVYQTYCSRHTDAVDILRGIQSRPEYVAFEKACAFSIAGAAAANPPAPALSALGEDLDAPSEILPSSLLPSPTIYHSPEDETKAFFPPSAPIGEQPVAPIQSRAISAPARSSLKGSKTPSVLPKPPSSPSRSHSRPLTMRSRPASLHLWRRSPTDPVLTDPSTVTGVDDIRPISSVPTVAPLMTTLPGAPKAGKLLEFRDLLIKPIQRVCRYPLLLEQLRSPLELTSSEDSARLSTLERALMATKKVAKDVDDARERQDAVVKNRRILERFEVHSSVTPNFLRSLGECKLGCSLDVIYHHPVYAPLTAPIKVKYFAAFVYNGYMLLVKVRKSKAYQPQHWFALESVKIKDLERDDSLLSHSFRLSIGEHHFEYGASCAAEKDIWIRCLAKVIESGGPPDCPESSLQLIEARHTTSQAIDEPSSTTRKRRRSTISSSFPFTVPNSPSRSSMVPKDDDVHSQVPSEGESLASKIRRPALMRVSTVNLTSIFTSDPSAITIRRSTPQSRTIVDRNLVDVASNVCLTARMQAQLRGELFQPFKLSASALQPPNPPKNWVFGSNTLPRRSLPIGRAESTGRMPSHLERQEPTLTTISKHRKSRSLPKNPTARDLSPLIIDHAKGVVLSGPPSAPLHQRRQSNDTAPPSATTSPHDDSDEEYAGSIWDDVLSSTHTDLTSEEVHVPARVRVGSIAGVIKAIPTRSMTVPRVEEPNTSGDVHIMVANNNVHGDLQPGTVANVSYLGSGLTNCPPRQQPSLLKRSLTAMTRRRTKSTPTRVSTVPPHTDPLTIQRALSDGGSLGISPPVPNIPNAGNPLLLSPYWNRGPVSARSGSPIMFDPSLVDLKKPPAASQQGTSRPGIDLHRLPPNDVDVAVVTNFSSPLANKLDPPPKSRMLPKTRRSLFHHLNHFTPMSSKD